MASITLGVNAGFRCMQVFDHHPSPRSRPSSRRSKPSRRWYQRVRANLDETLRTAIRTAVRRQVLMNEGGVLSICQSHIGGYDMDFLKSQFLAAVSENGRVWMERKDAIRAFSRWFGFRRTGSVIDDTARKLISRLLKAMQASNTEPMVPLKREEIYDR